MTDFHKSATHVDAHGMPVAFYDGSSPFHPTPCCGAAVSIFCDDGTTYCKACYADVDDLFAGAPSEPFKPIHRATVTRRGSGYGFRCTCGEQPHRSSKRRVDAERWAKQHEASA